MDTKIECINKCEGDDRCCVCSHQCELSVDDQRSMFANLIECEGKACNVKVRTEQ